MKYYFISDVHGEYDKMIQALEQNGFNKSTDTLVTLGDLFDRGSKSLEVLQYVMSCPNRVLVCGNHDFRLRELFFLLSKPDIYDNMNGVKATLNSFLNSKHSIYWNLQLIRTSEYKNVRELLIQYFSELVWSIEFSDLIGVHAWVPIDRGVKSWRGSSKRDWAKTIWLDSRDYIIDGCFPDKKIIFGHMHTYLIAEKCFGDKSYEETNDIYQTKDFIAIDGCANCETGKVNVYVYESDKNYDTIKAFDF